MCLLIVRVFSVVGMVVCSDFSLLLIVMCSVWNVCLVGCLLICWVGVGIVWYSRVISLVVEVNGVFVCWWMILVVMC